MEREVLPEILDSLPPDDPRAIRSRRDLKRLNFCMGNDRWIRSVLARNVNFAKKGIVEIGAGNGDLLRTLAPLAPTTGLDLQPRPEGLPGEIKWYPGNLFEQPSLPSGGVLLANLFLHHFEPDDLKTIGALMEPFELLIFSEPLRLRRVLTLSQCVTPLVGSVTRHDMPVSIRAGFTMGELPTYLGLSDSWRVTEMTSVLGAIRTIAKKRP